MLPLVWSSVFATDIATMFATTSPFLFGLYTAEILSVCGVLLYVIYQYFFSPLAKYPGPFWAKLTKLYRAYLALRGHAHRDFIALHKKYGKIVRVAPNELYFALLLLKISGAFLTMIYIQEHCRTRSVSRDIQYVESTPIMQP